LKGFGRKQAMILNQIKCLEGGHPTREGWIFDLHEPE
jgi:hypothetical protein